MANHLGVSPSRILLLSGETELSPTATLRTLKLGVADIIGEWKARKRGLEAAFVVSGGWGSEEVPETGSAASPPLQLGISILLSIDCVVLTSSSEATETTQKLRLRVQGKEKHQMLEISLSPVSRSAAHTTHLSFLVSCHLVSWQGMGSS